MSQPLMHDHWHILGAGAIGALWAKSVEPRASFIFSDEAKLKSFQQAQSKTPGFCLENNTGIHSIAVQGECPKSLNHNIKQLLVCTKAQQTLSAITAIKNNINEQTLIVLMQNGLAVYEALKNILPNNTILSASTTHGAYKQSPFHVVN